MEKLDSWIFAVTPVRVLPSWTVAITKYWQWYPQKYVSGVGWTSYQWGCFRFYKHVSDCICVDCRQTR